MTELESKVPWEGQPYSVKRHGVTIQICESEPVQTPGCVQAHGALIVLRASDLTVLQVSENIEPILGHVPEDLLGRSIEAVVGPAEVIRLRALLVEEPTERNPLFAFTWSGPARGPAIDQPAQPLDVTVHTLGGLAILELEATGRSQVPAPDYYTLVKTTLTRLQTALSVQALCDVTVEEMRALTGFDRVMAYRFHPDHHGEVVAESRRADLPSWLGLHYPADDIPHPVRVIFEKIWTRPVPDVGGGLAELIPLINPDTGESLDMTYCALRGASVMYTEYLENMQVKATLTLPIRRPRQATRGVPSAVETPAKEASPRTRGEPAAVELASLSAEPPVGDGLWGLIACHHYAGPRMVPYQVRAACELLAQVVSLQLKTTEDRDQLAQRIRVEGLHDRLVAHGAADGDLSRIIDASPGLLDALPATGAALFHRDRWWLAGRTPAEDELDALADWLNARPDLESATRPIYTTDALARDYPGGSSLSDVAAGLLAFPLSRARRSLVLWFRPETIQTIHWGGNPHDKPTVLGPHGPRLTPRRSFELFVESVRGRSLPWEPVEVEAAARLRLLLMELVVTRAEKLAELNAELARSNEELDAFAYVASHDLKEPLRGIHKYAHQILEDSADLVEEDRRRLQALTRLSVRMDGLLESLLQFSRAGRTSLLLEEVDMNEVLEEALDTLGVPPQKCEPGDEMVVEVPRRLPLARCDHVRSREILVNLISNGLKYNDKKVKWVEVGYVDPEEPHPRPGCSEESARHTIFYVRDNGIGIEARHRERIFKIFKRLHGREAYGGGTGVGLTIVKKLVERHRGQVWLESVRGQGTTIYFTLPGEEAVA